MLLGKALTAILSANTNVSNVVATRIYSSQAPENVKTFPIIVLRGEGTDFGATMEGPTNFGSQMVTVACLAPIYADAVALGSKVLSALVGTKGSYGGITIDMIFFSDEAESEETLQDMGRDSVLQVKEIKVKVWFRLA